MRVAYVRNKAMWFFFKIGKRLETFRGSEGGITLIETLIALAILGAIVAAIASGLAITQQCRHHYL